MQTQTVERVELHQAIDSLPDDSVTVILDFVKNLQLNTEAAEWIDPIEISAWNAETMEALKEVESGNLISFRSKKELFEFLDS